MDGTLDVAAETTAGRGQSEKNIRSENGIPCRNRNRDSDKGFEQKSTPVGFESVRVVKIRKTDEYGRSYEQRA